MDFLAANRPFGVSALVIGLGYLLKRLGLLKESDGEGLARIALNITLPAVILLNVPAVELNRSTAVLPLASLVSSTLTVMIASAAFARQERSDKGLALTSCSGYNIGLFAMPLVAGLYGAEGIARFALLDIGNVMAIFVTAYYLAWRYSPMNRNTRLNPGKMALMFLKSVPLLTYIAALAMNLSGFRITGSARDFLSVLADMNRGAALLTLGILLRFRFDRETWKAILPPLALRYGFGAAAAAAVLFLLPMPLENRIAFAGVLVMPMGLTLIPYAVQWGYNRERAAAIINLGIPVSFVLFWIVWYMGRML